MLALLMLFAAQPNPVCTRYVVVPGPEQGFADSALVTKAIHHETGPRDLGTVLAMGQWRVVWAAPSDSEHGVFFFRGARGSERFINAWGGAGASRQEAFRWATHTIHVPAPLARCFADKLKTDGI